MDSAGMGALISYYVASQKRGAKIAAVGVNYRVLELFKLTHMDGLIATYATVEDAESREVGLFTICFLVPPKIHLKRDCYTAGVSVLDGDIRGCL